MPMTSGGFSRLSGAFGSAFSSKNLPIRRPTALTAISSYGELFKQDLSGEIQNPLLRFGIWEFTFEDGTWVSSDVGKRSGKTVANAGERTMANAGERTVTNRAGETVANGGAISDNPVRSGAISKSQLQTLREENNLLVCHIVQAFLPFTVLNFHCHCEFGINKKCLQVLKNEALLDMVSD
jgi:hypothetical protein